MKSWLCKHIDLSTFLPLGIVALSVPCAALGACSEAATTASEPTAAAGTEILGGNIALDATFDAAGALVGEIESDAGVSYEFLCSAMLVGPKVAVTARHCVDAVKNFDEGRVFFGIGEDSAHPRRTVEIVRAESPFQKGGWPEGYGRDVGIVVLAEPVPDVHTGGVGQLEDSDIGTRFTVAGYGFHDMEGGIGTRQFGDVTLRARSGKVYQFYFGTLGAFETWVEKNTWELRPHWEGPTSGTAWDDFVRKAYEDTALIPDYQAFVGGVSGDVQPCHGDSGGPLLRKKGGEFVTYGVTSGSLPGCTRPVVYATFGPEIYDFLVRATKEP